MLFDKANILVIDDDPDLSEFLTEILVKEEYKVSASTSINDALYRLKNDIFDIVLLDLKLPDMSGVEGITEIRKASPHSKVIIITAYPSIDSAISTIKGGAVDYLKKPFENEELFEVIKNNIDMELRENIPAKIGNRIKAIRKGKGIRIKQLAARSSLTESSISMIENEKISPSITTINKIAVALGVHPIEFFDVEKHKRCMITRKEERRHLEFGNPDNVLEYLAKNEIPTNNEIFISSLGPAQKSFEEPITHEGSKFGYVLKGIAELELGNEKIMLHEGDSIFFEAVTPHLWKNTGSRESKTLWIVNRE